MSKEQSIKPYHVQDWWDNFHPIDRKSICEHFHLQEYLAKMDFMELPGFIRQIFYGQWQTKNSIINVDNEWNF